MKQISSLRKNLNEELDENLELLREVGDFYDENLHDGYLITKPPTDKFRPVTKKNLKVGDPIELLTYYAHWKSYFSYMTSKWEYISSYLEDKYKNLLKESVLSEENLSEKKKEAKCIQENRTLSRSGQIAKSKYRDAKHKLDMADTFYALVSRKHTISTDLRTSDERSF